MTTGWIHHYVSTACEHAQMESRPELHTSCRNECKYATGTPEPCQCSCHGESGTQPGRTSPVDQARDVARDLLAVVLQRPLSGPVLSPELEDRIAHDPGLFWLRGEEHPPGEWRAADA